MEQLHFNIDLLYTHCLYSTMYRLAIVTIAKVYTIITIIEYHNYKINTYKW